MKKISFTALMAILAFVSCQEDLIVNDFLSEPVTKSGDSDTLFSNKVDTVKISKCDALKIVEPITSKYPGRWVDISDDIILAGTKIAYNQLGHIREVDDLSYYCSPDYDAWGLVVDGDLSVMGPQSIIHIFVNVSTGEYDVVELSGRAIVKWDTSRYVFEYPDKDSIPNARDFSVPPPRTSSHAKYAVLISGGTDMYNNTSCFF